MSGISPCRQDRVISGSGFSPHLGRLCARGCKEPRSEERTQARLWQEKDRIRTRIRWDSEKESVEVDGRAKGRSDRSSATLGSLTMAEA